MFRNLAPAAVFAAALAAAGGLAPDAALAAGCLSSKEARSAVQNGQAVSLSKMVKRIEKATGGQILPTPELCKNGGRLTYTVKVLKPDGSVETLTVDAASGNIAGY
ncbi:MAG: PepSY domain-containing protein [Bauldia sp.]|nr:PepSY domain-containing protein [Bauldia sp.]